MMMSIPTTTQVDDESMMLLSSLLGSGISNQPNTAHHGPGEQNMNKVKKRRKRCRREGEEAKKRKLSDEQVRFLEMSFVREKKLESGRKVHLASEIGLDPKQVAVWFQNRRARWKSKQLEGEYMKLKSEHEAAIVEKFRLQAEILKLKDQLSEAQTKITKLSGGYGDAGDQTGGGETSSSPCTSFSVDTTHCQSIFKDEEFDCINEYNYMNMLDWMDFYGM